MAGATVRKPVGGRRRPLLPRLLRPVRPLLHLWFRLTRGLTLGVRAAILDESSRVFLVRHSYVEGWHLPGGGVEAGEDILSALAREVREEAAIAIEAPPRLHGIFFNGHVSRRDHVAVYVVRSFRVLQPKRPDREIAEAGFFPLDGLPDGTSQGTRTRLAEIVGGMAPKADWSASPAREAAD